MKERFSEKQLYALEVIGFEPKTASELGVAASTLTSLVKRGYIEKIGTKSPFKYQKIAIKHSNPGAVTMTTIDGKEFECNIYCEDSNCGKKVVWTDVEKVSHEGTLIRMRQNDKGFYVRSREYKGIVFIDF